MLVSVGFPTGMEGLTYPIPFSEPEALLRIAQTAEALGYHSIWGNDHMTTQRYVRAEFGQAPRFWEPLVTYAWLASQTTNLRFGTGILVLPMRRDIVVTAKQIATLDQLSGGRLEIGVGVGAYREEFEALAPGDTGHRGDMVAEGVAALLRLFQEERASYDGDYYAFRDVELSPKPLQARIPVYYGGNNFNQVRRTAVNGDGWMPAALPVARLAHDVAELRTLTEAEGRDFSKIAVAPQYMAYLDQDHDRALRRGGRSPEEPLERLGRHQHDAGGARPLREGRRHEQAHGQPARGLDADDQDQGGGRLHRPDRDQRERLRHEDGEPDAGARPCP